MQAETVVSGLEVPWGIAFLAADEWLVTERPGRIRHVVGGALEPVPVASVDTGNSGEGGLLGIALHPDVADNGQFFIYVTTGDRNRIERWELGEDHRSAERLGIVLDGIPAARYHDGGRLKIGPDGMLYAGTGDAGVPERAQDPQSLAGKILRLSPDHTGPAPAPQELIHVSGVRNVEAFDWLDGGTLAIADHGPSGELGRSGHDEVSVVSPGANLGWPAIWGCQSQNGMVSPSLVFRNAVPPGGAVFYRGDRIPDWQGSLLVGTLGSRHLHRVVFASDGTVERHEVYFHEDLGRLREVAVGPDGELYVMTSNCDGRGECPPELDEILRVSSSQ